MIGLETTDSFLVNIFWALRQPVDYTNIISINNYYWLFNAGADEWRKTSIDEVMCFYENKFFDDKTLLNLITETTSKSNISQSENW